MNRDTLQQALPTILCVLVLCLAFAWTYTKSIDALSPPKPFSELSTYPTPGEPSQYELELSTSIDPARESAGQSSPARNRPDLRWPALLFCLAFVCGWLARHLTKNPSPIDGLSVRDESLETVQVTHHPALAITDIEDGELRVAELDDRIIALHEQLAAFSDQPALANSDNATELELLKKKNLAKAEIISTLEDLVSENREKWLARDETEAQMNQRIKELTDDLNSAVRMQSSKAEDR